MNYYNEFDPKAAAWLRELIRAKAIPDGVVDERSITDVSPADLTAYTQCHFFAGIGGWPLALRLAGWPDDRPVWTGSCPCQPFSAAGKGLGTADARHLWPQFGRLIALGRPPTVFGEQVASKDALGWLDGVFADLEAADYACGALDLCAAGVGSPHIRQRIYWVADADPSERRANHSTGDDVDRGNPGREEGNLQFRTDGATGGLEHAVLPGLEGLAGDGDHGNQPGRLGAQPDRPAPAAGGAWDSYNLLPCTDGKTRRIESGAQCLVDGLPKDLDGSWQARVDEIEKEITAHAQKTHGSSKQTLREMQRVIQPEFLQWRSGGPDSLQPKAVLFAALCQLERKLGNVVDGETPGVAEALRSEMRPLRNGETFARPPQGPGFPEQRDDQLGDLVRQLSQAGSRAGEIAPMIMHGFPLHRKFPARVGLLRGFGNAIVPQVAAEFVSTFLTCRSN